MVRPPWLYPVDTWRRLFPTPPSGGNADGARVLAARVDKRIPGNDDRELLSSQRISSSWFSVEDLFIRH